MEIQVGEYVRIKGGTIDKVSAIDRKKGWLYNTEKGIGRYAIGTINDIERHSFDIRKLIEDGDYVNGYPIVELKDGKLYSVDFCMEDQLEFVPLENIDIFETIVTKELFKDVEYEVR